ncbi:BaiN/RdsA family NAD(P)/FAD-dependent oxidoreductase [Acetivibrio saccincola]|uniref:Aminoacetone oxidase family FAD-binding enzyme n=1 Tax=Acetivibrio saccincola TaxID=1677857 RepID=A0A2K9E2G3_9FIRM|nr:NAD(P)/FAD-dependent oxidoreductase [Acetivibrio saccincola]AUG57559.1 tricarballylate dehydrogenase [Acetivibrio saccincola]NLW26056.1 NAD(P)/FAD-dependent oxidoreductase [Acetivibrio saccincola]PQQ67469.1 aminoacetone oxidase family FAD-binding enzyme [Acetivibrio saccincola]HOA98130.1 NAD(P)/FAD-dependent oxidoreductase [Acetivibrio saccincola]HQD29270.1 NAD(P)/FAD-dependent oxidoreductase [Acetivibrio saccincola]
MKKKIVVIGAGPAGIMAAGKAAENGNQVILVEKNNRIGRKILISGKGRCNITNNTDIEGLIENTPGNGCFLYSAFYTFSNTDLIDFFNKYGLKTKVERGGRVFPVSDNAKDVVDTLNAFLKKKRVDLWLNSPVEKILTEDKKVTGIMLKSGKIISCDMVVLATGGASYPGTGSTGDGYKMAKELGHTIVPLKPSLVPLITKEEWVKDLQGLSLKNVSITLVDNKGKKIYSDFGEMLFTHFGVSGPIILSASRHILDYDYKGVKLIIDLKPALAEEKLDERIQRDFLKFSRKQFKNSLDELLPQKLIPVIVRLSKIDSAKTVNQITKEERRFLVKLLKNLTLTINGARPIEEAIVTSGGVSVDEINPSTMESKLIKGLFFAGEVIDLDAYTGGFNLTIAFSTGYLAGMNCK